MSKLFVIRRWFPPTRASVGSKSRNPYLRAFIINASAQECCAALDRAERVRRDVNPFDYGPNLDDCTSFPPPILCDWLLESGLTPPEDAWEWQYTWRDWWLVVAERATELQIARVWQAMDKVRFFVVEEVKWIGDKKKHIAHKAYVVCLCLDEHTMRSAEQDHKALAAYDSLYLAEEYYLGYARGDYGVLDFEHYVLDLVELPLEK